MLHDEGRACRRRGRQQALSFEALFTRLPPSETGIHFENGLEDTEEVNVFTYRNYHNGGARAWKQELASRRLVIACVDRLT